MIQNSLRNNQYFINVTNIFYNLFNALTTLRLILAQKTQLSRTPIGKEKRTFEILNHYYGMVELHFYLPFHNLHTNIVHLNLTFFSLEPTKNHHHFEIFILVILDNITLCSAHPHRNKDEIMRPHNNKISIVKIFKWGIC